MFFLKVWYFVVINVVVVIVIVMIIEKIIFFFKFNFMNNILFILNCIDMGVSYWNDEELFCENFYNCNEW